MEHHTTASHTARVSHATPKDFFLWLGAVLALYGAVSAFLALVFTYINSAFPDNINYYGDSLSSGARVAMASLIVLVPLALGLLLTIRRGIVSEPGKANIWVRRWALVLTIFLAAATAAIDLITLLTMFLGGDLTERFALKATMVLLVAVSVCLHFLADYKGYWTLHRRKANIIGAAVGALTVLTIVGGFIILGTPSEMRARTYDSQRVNDLSSIQYQITDEWQLKQTLPATLSELSDPLNGYSVPVDPDTDAQYEYHTVSATTFELCATFAAPSSQTSQNQGYMSPEENFQHAAGHTCFSRTIDPDKYPALNK